MYYMFFHIVRNHEICRSVDNGIKRQKYASKAMTVASAHTRSLYERTMNPPEHFNCSLTSFLTGVFENSQSKIRVHLLKKQGRFCASPLKPSDQS